MDARDSFQQMTVAQRLQEYIQSVPTTAYQVAKDCGFARGSLEKMLRKGGGLHSDTIAAVLGQFPDLDADWLITGKGNMLKAGASTLAVLPPAKGKASPPVRAVQHALELTGNIIVLDSKAAAGLFKHHGQVEYPSSQPRMRLPGMDGNGFFAIQVQGDSMEPTVMEGDWLVIREQHDRDQVHNGRLYVIVTKGGAVAKRLRRSLGGESFVCESDNPAHKPYTIGADDSPIVYDVLGLVRERVDGQPHGLYHRMLKIERDVAALRNR